MPPPQFSSEDQEWLSTVIKIPVEEIRWLSAHIDEQYDIFTIQKGKKKRKIKAPKPPLKHLHSCLLSNFLYSKQAHDSAHGFVPKRSIVTNARPHVRQNWVANFDIQDFFPSTSRQTVRHIFRTSYQLSPGRSDLLTRLCTLDRQLPQGAPTSPHLANLAMIEADVQLSELAKQHRLQYTRYADDMTFSGMRLPASLATDIQNILSRYSYKLATRKSRYYGRHRRQMVTGLVVNDKLNLPRPLRRRLRAILNDVQTQGSQAAFDKASMDRSQFEGLIALQAMWDPKAAHEQLRELWICLDHEGLRNQTR